MKSIFFDTLASKMTFIAFVGLFQYSIVFLVSFKATSARKCQIFAKAMFLEFWNKSTHKLPVWPGSFRERGVVWNFFETTFALPWYYEILNHDKLTNDVKFEIVI